jgi:SpoVK/Ycf46/Vps4 family AAA+-type ATPase
MGEKLLAQRILCLLRDTESAASPVARALLGWATDECGWLWPDVRFAVPNGDGTGETLDWACLARRAGDIAVEEDEPLLFATVRSAARLLGLEGFDSELLAIGVALARLPKVANLRRRLLTAGANIVDLAGRLAGAAPAEASARVRRSEPVALGLLSVASDCATLDLVLDWDFDHALDQQGADEEALFEALAGIRQGPGLAPADFTELGETFSLLARLLSGALRARAPGINLLIHGPPGTGKTELARTLAAAAGARLFAVGESDPDGDEPARWQRLAALRRGQRLLAPRGDSLILFDEMEDLFADAAHTSGGGRRAGSKIFVNRLFEANPVPTIWTSNDGSAIDPAHLWRMSFILRMDHPSPKARARIVARAAEAEGAAEAAAGLLPLAAREAETASIARLALRAAALAGGGQADAQAAGRSLILGLRGARTLPPLPGGGPLDLSLYEADREIAPLVERLAAPGAASDFSLLLTGPPGTGKTALAAHLAERLDRPLAVKRASDLLSKWLGETEANIAEAFAEARETGAVLLFDEADSLLLDRSDAQRSWEITQVNELLTWMDAHPLPFLAATNFARRLDPAALRRFVFKIELRAMSAEAAARAWARFFGGRAPAALAGLGGLTPGDFAVVRRQLRYTDRPRPAEILALLEAEANAKPERVAKVGF